MSFYNNNNSNSSVPNNELFNRIRASKASITETHAYFQALQEWIKQGDNYSDPQYSVVINHFTWIEMILEGLNEALPNASAIEATKPDIVPLPEQRSLLGSPQLERSYANQKTIAELEAEILAAATSRNPKLALTKVAALNNLVYSVIETLANNLLKDQGLESQHDLVKADYTRCMQDIRDIELKEDPGEKEWKLQDLARRHKRNKKDMLEAFYKSLLIQHLEDPISLAELRKTLPPSREWILRGFIPTKSLILLHGHGGSGKTLLVQHLLKLILQGIDWGEYKVRKANSGILYIQSDTGLSDVNESFKQAGIPDDVPIYCHDKWRIEYMSYLYKWAKQYRPSTIVIDSLSNVSINSTVTENETAYARPILALREISTEVGCSIFVIHHSNAGGEARGSKAIKAAVDEVWRLERSTKDESDPKRLLTIQKSRSRATMQYSLKFDDEDFSWDLLEPEDESGNPTQNSSARWLIVNHLNKHPGVRFCNQDLAQIIGCSPETIRKEFLNLAREGVIDRERNSKYDGHTKNEPKYLYYVTM